MKKKQDNLPDQVDTFTKLAKNIRWWIGGVVILVVGISTLLYQVYKHTDKVSRMAAAIHEIKQSMPDTTKYVTDIELKAETERYIRELLSNNIQLDCDTIKFQTERLSELSQFLKCPTR